MGNTIGYRVTVVRQNAERDIEVRTLDKRHQVRARRSAVERSFETELADRVLTALSFDTTSNDLGITVEILGTERRRRNRFALPVDVKISGYPQLRSRRGWSHRRRFDLHRLRRC